MQKIRLADLEAALRNPRGFRIALQSGVKAQFGPSYAAALRDAIFKYHRESRISARTYLTQRLARFKNADRQTETVESFDWYVGEYTASGATTFDFRRRLIVPLPTFMPVDVVCSGEIGRLDLVPGGGYAVWLLRSGSMGDWRKELQMPLIQATVSAQELGVNPADVSVGVIGLREHRAECCTFSVREITRAGRRFVKLLRDMGFGGSTAV